VDRILSCSGEHGKEPLASIKNGEVLDQLSDYLHCSMESVSRV
jgi:hypothetical protein